MSTVHSPLIKRTMSSLSVPARSPQRSTHAANLRRYFRWKGLVDRSLAAVLLIPGLPVIGFLVLLIRLTSRGPGIFRQVRAGKDGRAYTMFKLRSMRCDAEARTGAVWSPANDPRVTRLGRFLRKSHLDELPQLFNVLRGEMSLIGPRPERPEIVAVLADQIPGYMNRLRVLPGVTGLAQINLPPDTDLYSVRQKLALDLQHIAEASLLLDLRILLCTVLRLVGCSGTLAMRLTRLQRAVELPEGVDGRRVDLGILYRQDANVRTPDETPLTEDRGLPVGTVPPVDPVVLQHAPDRGILDRQDANVRTPDETPLTDDRGALVETASCRDTISISDTVEFEHVAPPGNTPEAERRGPSPPPAPADAHSEFTAPRRPR